MEQALLKSHCASLGFTDLHSFKDYVVVVLSCAPEMFLPEDWKAPEEQLNLERAFVGLRYGLDLTAPEIGDATVTARCRLLVEQAYTAYCQGQDLAGQRKLEELDELLAQIPSR